MYILKHVAQNHVTNHLFEYISRITLEPLPPLENLSVNEHYCSFTNKKKQQQQKNGHR